MNRRAFLVYGLFSLALIVIGSLRILNLAHVELNRALLQSVTGEHIQPISLAVKLTFLLNASAVIFGAILLTYSSFKRAEAQKQAEPNIKAQSAPHAQL